MKEYLTTLMKELIFFFVDSPGLLAGLVTIGIVCTLEAYVMVKNKWSPRTSLLAFSTTLVLSVGVLGTIAALHPISRIRIIRYDHMKYANVFGDIENCAFYAYNAPWQIEEDVERKVVIQVHKKRKNTFIRTMSHPKS